MNAVEPPAQTQEHPFALVLRSLTDHSCRYKPAGPDKIRATCPSHRDRRPSLVVTRRDDRVLLHCFAGCGFGHVLKALGLSAQDMFVQNAPHAGPPKMVASYDYVLLDGTLIAQKVRLEPKGFRWRRPDPQRPGGWRWSLEGVEPGLYRLPELLDKQQVFCVEGEKSADLLWGCGMPATCPPSGASKWDQAWSTDLSRLGCRELLILADADRSGIAHAQRVAALSYRLTSGLPGDVMNVKIIRLPGLSSGQDVFDWIQSGETSGRLLELASAARHWSPDAEKLARLERTRELTRERVRKWRDRRRMKRIPARGVA